MEILSRKPGTRQTDVFGQLGHESLAHGTGTFQGHYCRGYLAHGKQTFQGNCATQTWHTGHIRFRAIVSRKPSIRFVDGLWVILLRKSRTRQTDILGNCATLAWHTEQRHFRETLSRKPGTRYRNVLWQMCDVNVAHVTETLLE